MIHRSGQSPCYSWTFTMELEGMYLADSFVIGYLIVGNWKFQSYSGFEPGYKHLGYRVIGVAAARHCRY